jgi:hypothetical protein
MNTVGCQEGFLPGVLARLVVSVLSWFSNKVVTHNTVIVINIFLFAVNAHVMSDML